MPEPMPDPGALPLRDIHLPDPIGWWPPAPGWWLLAGLAVMLFAGGWVRRWWRRRPLRLQRAAMIEFKAIEQRFSEDGDRQRLLRELSILMRRICISRFPRRETAAVHGEAWLALLDRLGGNGQFSDGGGRVLAAGPYQRRPEFDPVSLLAACAAVLDSLKQTSGAAAHD